MLCIDRHAALFLLERETQLFLQLGEERFMKHIFENLFRHKLPVAVIIVLLVMQAYCDLALPAYTSSIVDVGLQQYGIEDCVMTQMSHSTGELLQQSLSEEGRQAFADAYVLNEETDCYELTDISKEAHSRLNDLLEQPIVMMYASNHMD